MVDLGFAFVLLVALVRAARARFWVGLAASAASLGLLAWASATAIASGAGEGRIEVPLGTVFVGPTAILDDERVAFATLVVWLVLSVVGWGAAWRRSAGLRPGTDTSERWVRLETIFVLAATFPAFRLVTVVTFLWLMARGEP